jgi:hypothetical protein
MTEQMARRLALEFVQKRQLPVSRATAVRRIRFQHPTEGPRDLWVICFAMELCADRLEFAREIIVEVRADTGETKIFGSGQREGT